MRVASDTLSQFLVNGSQTAQQALATLQQQISTGNSVTQASDNPLAFSEASQMQAELSQLSAYSSAISSATTDTSANNSAMTQIHQLLAQASEYATSADGTMSASDLQNLGTETSALISQLTSVVNQQGPDGAYLFGGTSNQPPLTSTGAYNPLANGNTTTTEVGPGNAVQTSIAAGGSGTPPTDGFLYDSATGVDVMAALKQTVTDLNSGNASAVQSTDLPALNAALDHISMYVGSTAANMAAVSTASTQNQQQTSSDGNHLNALTQTNLPVATVQLQQIQNQYQATLEAGSRILGLSILNYIGSVATP
jgi:flagellin-like hook-associated protein FlgL